LSRNVGNKSPLVAA